MSERTRLDRPGPPRCLIPVIAYIALAETRQTDPPPPRPRPGMTEPAVERRLALRLAVAMFVLVGGEGAPGWCPLALDAVRVRQSAAGEARPRHGAVGRRRADNQAKHTHAHHTTARTTTPWKSPLQVASWAMRAVHWVKAMTKTRSKKSSSGLTPRLRAARHAGGHGVRWCDPRFARGRPRPTPPSAPTSGSSRQYVEVGTAAPQTLPPLSPHVSVDGDVRVRETARRREPAGPVVA